MTVPSPTARARLQALTEGILARVGVALPQQQSGEVSNATPLEKLTELSRSTAPYVVPDVLAPAAPKPKPKRLSLREQREQAEARRTAADERWLKNHRARLRDAGQERAVWPRDVERMAADILGDVSQRSVLIWATRLRRQYSGTPIWAIFRAALQPRADGKTQRTWVDERARRIAVDGFAKLMVSKPSNRRSQWRRIVRGYSVASFQALQRYRAEPTRKPSRGAFSARWGYLRALERSGFMYRQQLPSSEVPAWERGRDRDGCERAFNRYWLVGLASSSNLETQLRLHAWHEAGWEAADQLPERAPRDRAPP